MPRWIDIDQVRRAIAAKAVDLAEDAGLENVRVHVRIEEPDKRGRRHIIVEATSLGVPEVEHLQGRRWQDN